MTQTRKEALTALLQKVEAGGIEHYHWSILGSAMPERTWSATKSAYHGSLDAAKALHEAVLPGWDWGLRRHADTEGDGYFAWATSADFRVDHYHAGGKDREKVTSGLRETGDNDAPARAWLIAILRALIALIAQEDHTDGNI